MTVQVSVTVWTILCFLALMLVLDRLLFRPLLAFMDARRDKIDGARRGRETALREREEALRRREEERVSTEKRLMAEASAALEESRRENERRLTEKKADNERRLAEERAALEEESQAILETLEPQTGKLAEIFADRLQSWQNGDASVAEGASALSAGSNFNE